MGTSSTLELSDAQVYGPQQARIQPLIDKILSDTEDHFSR